jgi:hypothetical protein
MALTQREKLRREKRKKNKKKSRMEVLETKPRTFHPGSEITREGYFFFAVFLAAAFLAGFAAAFFLTATEFHLRSNSLVHDVEKIL